jgi:hypothetical protein
MISPNGESEQGARRGQGECGTGVHREVAAPAISRTTKLNLESREMWANGDWLRTEEEAGW